jgi:dTMP kinase
MRTLAIEGIDASGKQSQCELLVSYLQSIGKIVKLASFPRYETPIGELIYKGLRNQITLSDTALHGLLEMDRQDFIATTFQDFKNNGVDFLIYDRFILSNMAYASMKGLSLDWLESIRKGVPHPHHTIILNLTAEKSYARKSKNFTDLDKHEKDLQLLTNVSEFYNKYPSLTLENVSLIDADQSIAKVHEDIIKEISYLL